MRHTGKVLGLALGLSLIGPAPAHASPFNVDPVTGQITAATNTLSFSFVSRSASFSHHFGLYSTSHVLISPVFSAPSPDAVGAVASIIVTPGTSFLLGLAVTQSGVTWFSDGASSPNIAFQDLKYRFTVVDEHTTLIEMEDLKNFPGTENCYDASNGWFKVTIETCDYNDMVVQVTNLPATTIVPEFDIIITTAPEPATMALLATGLVGLGGAGLLRRRRRS